MAREVLVGALSLVLLGCPGGERAAPRPEPEPGQGEPTGGPATPALFGADGLLAGPGAPDRLACATDRDCVITSIPSSRPPAPPASLAGCCATSGFDPASRAFHRWMAEFRVDHCPADRSGCPDLPAPARPAPCVREARCVEGRCDNACGRP